MRKIKPIKEDIKLKIIQMYKDGCPIDSITETLHVSRDTIKKYAKTTRRGTYKNWRKRNQNLCDYRADGKSYKEIAKKVGCTENAVKLAVYRHRKKTRGDPTKRFVIGFLLKSVLSGINSSVALKNAKEADVLRVITDV